MLTKSEKVRDFCKRSGKILDVDKVSEKSGNFIFGSQVFMKINNLFLLII